MELLQYNVVPRTSVHWQTSCGIAIGQLFSQSKRNMIYVMEGQEMMLL